ncbi:ferritin-like domain-containing protein [Sphingomonas sp. IC-56]|uniref:ferritin-like domain-containing protein n=1 Tax=Sphingomonas sp. IC-56 TaxID=2898529 RepID=UPI001E570E66|nr:ferritin-like domain-containing protein [Sphingomonas sp. IC-56]MCD2322770.1 ferritin-like domain-containing protein [Sphingomonas sp. IC-56]
MATTIDSTAAREVFVTGLKNAHALEHQAMALMDRQIEHLANYAEVETQLRAHRGETEGQIQRLETILTSLGESPSGLKDAALSFSGNMAALAHTFAPDEIIKNSFANYAFESFERASYEALITMAEEAGFTDAVPLLQETLREEIAMQQWVIDTQPLVIRKFLALRQSGETASH